MLIELQRMQQQREWPFMEMYLEEVARFCCSEDVVADRVDERKCRAIFSNSD